MAQVNSQRGWKLFLTGILVATFFGGALRLLVSPNQVRFWLEDGISSQGEKLNIEFSEAKILLSQGYLPVFRLHIHDLKISAKETCLTRSTIGIDDVYFPISLFDLFESKFNFGKIEANEIKVHLKPAICEAMVKEPDGSLGSNLLDRAGQPLTESSDQYLKSDLGQQIKLILNDRWDIEIANGRKWFKGLLVKSLKISEESESGSRALVQIHDFQFLLPQKNQNIHIEGSLDFSGAWSKGRSLGKILTRLEISREKIDLKLNGQIKEGTFELLGGLEVNTSSFLGDIKLKHIPAAPVFEALDEIGLSTGGLRPERFWISCQGNYRGSLSKLKQEPISISSCVVEGDVGHISIENLKIVPWEQKIEPFKISIQKLSLKKLAEALRRTGPDGILTKFGEVSGLIEVQSPQDVVFKGELKNLELFFSNKGVRGSQAVNSLKGELSLKDDRLSWIVSDVDLAGGSFLGMISFNMDREFRKGIIQITVENLVFNSSIQELMTGGSVGPLALFGQAKLEDGLLSQWRGSIGIKNAGGVSWALNGLKYSSVFDSKSAEMDSVEGKLTVNDFVMEPGHNLFKTIRPLFLGEVKKDENVKFFNIESNLGFQRGSGSWNKTRANVNGSEIVLSAEGEWNFQDGTKGTITVDLPELKLLKWELSGPFSDIDLIPNYQVLKKWAQKDSFSIKQGKASPAERKIFLNERLDYLEASALNKFGRTIGKKVMETARKYIPQGKKEVPEKENSIQK